MVTTLFIIYSAWCLYKCYSSIYTKAVCNLSHSNDFLYHFQNFIPITTFFGHRYKLIYSAIRLLRLVCFGKVQKTLSKNISLASKVSIPFSSSLISTFENTHYVKDKSVLIISNINTKPITTKNFNY